jgi:hypothetical protein
VNPCVGVRCSWIPDWDCPGNLSLGRLTGEGKSDGETFLGRMWMFFLGGVGRKRKHQGTVSRVCHWTTHVFKQPHFVIYYMLISGGFTVACLQTITKGVLDPRLPWAERVRLGHRQPVDLVHSLKTVKDLLLLVPSRTPRSSGYDVYAHVVYVVICYMSTTCICLLYVVICYMSFICLLYV